MTGFLCSNMKNNTIGKYIENEKKSQAISTKDLCRGICSLASYSRFKNSESIPDLLLLNCFLERLGHNPNSISFSCSEHEIYLFIFRNKIERAKNRNLELTKKLLCEYKTFNNNTVINEQFIDMIQGYICLSEYNILDAISYFSSALNRTNLKYAFSDELVLHRYEFECLYQLSILEKNVSHLYYLYNFLKQKMDFHYLKKYYFGTISVSLAESYIENKAYESASKIIDNSIRYMQKENQTRNLLELLTLKAKLNEDFAGELSNLKIACESINDILLDMENHEYI